MIYLASPYSHKSKQIEAMRFVDVTQVAAQLIAKHGHAMFLPITQSHMLKYYSPKIIGGTDFQYWADIDLYAIEKSDEVWVVKLDGWKESIGVTAEIKHAKKLKKPVKFIDPSTLQFTKGN